jgi:hypothetical protein
MGVKENNIGMNRARRERMLSLVEFFNDVATLESQ